MFAASALAANTVARSAAGAASPLFTQYMFDALGVGGGGSLIGGVAVLLAPIPFVFYKYGEPIRKRSKFAPTEQRPADDRAGTERGHQDEGSESDLSSVDSRARPDSGIDRTARADGSSEKELEDLDGPPRSEDPEKDLERGV